MAGHETETKIASAEVFAEYEKVQRAEMLSHLMAVHLASNFMSPNGYFLQASSKDSLDDPSRMPVQAMAKRATMQSCLNLAHIQSKPEIIYVNTAVNVLVLERLLTDKNKKKYPSKNYMEWTPLEGAANLIKMWAFGEHRPENG